MDPHLYQAARQLPSGDARVKPLYDLAVSPGNSRVLASRVRAGLWMVAALLLASGLIFWVAANWQEQSRWFKLGLIEAALAASVLAACLWSRMRLAALLCATLVLGGLLAFVGQTYQTGADAWQLFAVWAALALIWVAVARNDFLWLLWVLIAACGIVMWTGRFDQWDFWFRGTDALPQMLVLAGLWLLLAMLPALLSLIPALRVSGEMGWWSHRVALGCALASWTAMGMTRMFAGDTFMLGLDLIVVVLLLAGALYLSLYGRFQDFMSTCLVTFAVNVLLLAWVGRVLAGQLDVGALLIFGMIALGCLGGSVRWLMGVQKSMHAQALHAIKEGL